MKKCSKCCEEKELDAFYKEVMGHLGRKSRCKKCSQAANTTYRVKNAKKVSLKNKRYEKYRRDHQAELIMFNSAKTRAKRKKLAFNLKLEDITIPSHCPVFGIPLIRNLGNRGHGTNSPSLDRIDNSKGYVKGNVDVISMRANSLKNSGTIEELKQLVTYMEKHRDGK